MGCHDHQCLLFLQAVEASKLWCLKHLLRHHEVSAAAEEGEWGSQRANAMLVGSNERGRNIEAHSRTIAHQPVAAHPAQHFRLVSKALCPFVQGERQCAFMSMHHSLAEEGPCHVYWSRDRGQISHLSSSSMSSTMMVCASWGTRDQWQTPVGKDILGRMRPVPLLMMVRVLVSSETQTVSQSSATDMALSRASACSLNQVSYEARR